MRARLKVLAVTAGAVAALGIGAGAVAATSGGGDPASDLAGAINKRAGTTITKADVQGAFTDLMKQRLADDVAAGRLTQAQADQILKDAQSGNGMPGFGFRGGPGGPGGHHGPRVEILAPVAKLLGTTEAQLKTKLQSGKTLTQVAKDAGVSKADLVAAIKAQLKAHKPQGAPALTDAQLTDMATHIADGTGRGPGGPGGHRPDFDGDGPHGFGPPPMGQGSGSGSQGGSYNPAPSTNG